MQFCTISKLINMFYTLIKTKREKIIKPLAALHLQPGIWEDNMLSRTDSLTPYNSDL